MFNGFYFKESKRLKDPIYNYRVDESKVNLHFLKSGIKSAEHKDIFGGGYKVNHNFIFETIYSLLKFPYSKYVRERGFPFLSPIIRLSGHTNLKNLKLHLDPRLHFFPKNKLHFHVYTKMRNPGALVPAYLNIYRPHTVYKSNIEYTINKGTAENVHIKNLFRKDGILQSKNIKFIYLLHVLSDIIDIDFINKDNNSNYILKKIFFNKNSLEFLLSYIVSVKSFKNRNKKRNVISNCFFFNKSILVKFNLSRVFNLFLCKFIILKKKRKYIPNFERKKLVKNPTVILEKIKLGFKYIHPGRISNTSNGRRQIQVILLGLDVPFGLKTKLDVFSETSMLQTIDFSFLNTKVPLLLNSNHYTIKREHGSKPEIIYEKHLDLKEMNLKKDFIDNSNSILLNKRLFFKSVKGLFSLREFSKIRRRHLLYVYKHPFAYTKYKIYLDSYGSEEVKDGHIKSFKNLAKYDSFFFGGKKNSEVDLEFFDKKTFLEGNSNGKLGKIGNPFYLNLNNVLDLGNKNYLSYFLNKYKYSKNMINNSLMFKRAKRFGNIIFIINQMYTITSNKSKLPKLINWQRKKKKKFEIFKYQRIGFAMNKYKIKQRLVRQSFKDKFLNIVISNYNKGNFNNDGYFKLGNNIIYKNYQIIKPNDDNYFYFRKISNNLKHLMKLKQDYLEDFIKIYTEKRKQLLGLGTFKHEFLSLNLNIICFYKLFHELYIAFIFSLNENKNQFDNRFQHKRSSRSYHTKYNIRRGDDIFNKYMDSYNFGFDKRLFNIKDITDFYFIKASKEKDMILKIIYFRIFLAIIHLLKIKKLGRFKPFGNIFLLIILTFFKKIFILNIFFIMHKQFKLIFSNLKNWDFSEIKNEFLDLFSLKIYGNNIFLINPVSVNMNKIGPTNLPSSKIGLYFKEDIRSYKFPFIKNGEFLDFYRMRRLMNRYRFKYKVLNIKKDNKRAVGYRSTFTNYVSFFDFFQFSGIGSFKYFDLRVYKSTFIFSSTLFYHNSEDLVKDLSFLHNPQPFYFGYYTISHRPGLVK